MFPVNPQPKPQPKSLPTPVIMVAIMIVLAAGGFWLLQKYGSGPAQPEPITAEAKAYVKHLKLAEVEMKAHESFAKQQLLEITGKISNAGDRPIKQITINCIFYDPYNREVHRERSVIVKSSAGLLNPGDTREFRMAFDTIPSTWSNAMPQLVIAQILF